MKAYHFKLYNGDTGTYRTEAATAAECFNELNRHFCGRVEYVEAKKNGTPTIDCFPVDKLVSDNSGQ